MLKFAKRAALAGVAAALAFPAVAADAFEPAPIIEAPEPAPVYEAPASVGGWYIRGDVGYHESDLRDIEYYNMGPPVTMGTLSGKLSRGYGIGGGVGYQATDHFRTDLTVDHWFKKDFRGSSAGSWESDPIGNPGVFTPYTTTDESSVSTWLLLANAYVDIGTWYGWTAYAGAGIGGAHVKWDDLTNTPDPSGPPGVVVHAGAGSWRFAAAAMAGASYCINKNLKFDAGYRFSHIKGGKMFEYAAAGNNGPGFDGGFNTHEVRGGLRYQFGGSGDCGPNETPPPPYEPPPVYK